jgi:flagellar biogenesis protein FliO
MPKPPINRRVLLAFALAIGCCAIAPFNVVQLANAQSHNDQYSDQYNQQFSDRNPRIVSPGFEITDNQSVQNNYSNQRQSTQVPHWSEKSALQQQPIVRAQHSPNEENVGQFNDSIPITLPDPNGDSPPEVQPASSKNRVLTTVTSSLVIVISLFLLLIWLTRRTMPKSNYQLPSEVVETLGRATLSNRQAMQLVKVGSKLILLCVTPTGAETLTEITDADEVQRLIALCQTGQGTSITSSFRQVLHQMGEEPAPAGFLGNDEDSTDEAAPTASRMENYHA